jgi:hypothetical protein
VMQWFYSADQPELTCPRGTGYLHTQLSTVAPDRDVELLMGNFTRPATPPGISAADGGEP